MTTIRSILAAMGCAAALALAAAAPASAQERVALVIGNGKYVHATALPNPGNDARAVAKALGDIGFAVSQGVDLDRSGMERLMRDFLRKAASARVALLFYAGHGMQVDGKNYLVPVDAKLEAASDLTFETIELDKLLDNLNDPARANIVILDACRDNPLARSFAARLGPTRSGAVSTGLAAYSALGTGTLIAFATAPGQVALDGQGTNSPFTQGLVKHLATPGLEVRQMLTRVRADVAAATRHRQIPWDNSSLLGEVYLASRAIGVQPAPGAAPPAAQPQPDPAAQAWAVMQNTTSIAVLEDFIRQFGSTTYGSMARARLEELKKSQIAVVAPPVPPAAPPSPVTPAVGVFPPGPGVAPLTAERERGLKPKDSFKECDTCPEMVVAPSGSFTMGSPASEKERFDSEGPQHRVTFSRQFAVGKFAVTFDEWDACVRDGGCNGYRPADQGWGRGRRPVINVSWDDAKTYIAWLSRKTGKSYRLLSEAEREYVTRAGTTTPFWTGSTISTSQANYDGNYTYGSGSKGEYRQKTVPVDSFQPNPFGLYQVHGNVWEWTEDCWNGSYAGAPTDGSAWTRGDCASRVVRGGSWGNNPRSLRSANRLISVSANRDNDSGFRVARTLLTP